MYRSVSRRARNASALFAEPVVALPWTEPMSAAAAASVASELDCTALEDDRKPLMQNKTMTMPMRAAAKQIACGRLNTIVALQSAPSSSLWDVYSSSAQASFSSMPRYLPSACMRRRGRLPLCGDRGDRPGWFDCLIGDDNQRQTLETGPATCAGKPGDTKEVVREPLSTSPPWVMTMDSRRGTMTKEPPFGMSLGCPGARGIMKLWYCLFIK
mmetsp:Transcript_112527/g.223647  ORF Transcript_112527/g.223647 Transcript_112527/m.223647 type:complete len:213 (-) Transcript_112527:833-1471(-)